jgi:hypothetical protein
MSQTRLRIGFIPEHFSTPLHFAQKHYNLNADLIPFPTGTGALTSALKISPKESSGAIDIAIGLTEGFVADLGKTEAADENAGSPPGYGLVGTYVESPLCWAISTGAKRDDINTISDLRGTKVGVSRIGSGSYVMSFVLGDQQNWLSSSGDPPFEIVPIGDFAALRKAVNEEGRADFFMWEHFTSKKFWDEGRCCYDEIDVLLQEKCLDRLKLDVLFEIVIVRLSNAATDIVVHYTRLGQWW